ncbi:protein mono-ADP-ribosyltransferase PARP4 [Amia ocellicauda]|uniref:protein mono-ADP-ribosyltransferase PARP4 n=1 Tax=Amia ocellicauda TaxID=2972642 RepID=UPI00346496B4
MPVFENCLVALEVKDLPIKEKNNLKKSITANGGSITYVINKKCTYVVASNMDTVSSNRLTSIRKFQVPVVGMEYVSQCLEKGRLLNTGDYPPAKSQRHSPPPATTHWGHVEERSGEKPRGPPETPQEVKLEENAKGGSSLGQFRIYRENEAGLPAYPSDFKVAKYLVLKKADAVVVVELHSCKGNPSLPFRVTQLWRSPAGQAPKTKKEMIFTLTSEDAMMAYRLVLKELKDQGFSPMKELPSDVKLLGSEKLGELLLEQSLNSSTISKEVAVFVELLWTEALGRLSNLLLNPISSVSSNDVSRAEGILQQLRKALSNGANQGQLFAIMAEFYRVLPHKNMADTLITPKVVSQKEDLCQLIRDIINVSEATLWSSTPSSLAKYRALRCSIEHVDPGTAEFFTVKELVKYCSVEIHRVLRVCRVPELLEFKRELGNVRPLLHASAPSNFVGILSRGLLLPKVAVEQHGVKRTDLGNLGSGIYFSDSMRTSMSYAKPTVTDGTRLLVVCDVALGECRDLRSRDPSLVSAPTGCHSVHGVRQTPQLSSDFQDDEYVVYNTNQTKIKYVVQFSEDYEEVKAFEPTVDISTELSEAVLIDDSVSEAEADCSELCKNPLEGMMAGLQDSAGKLLPLQRVHVKGRVIDLLAEIIIFQTYTNHSTVPIEAKYVFPLDESAAVCGFEAFINGKHLVGEVKEKEQARREYRQAIEKGHGAYLMDQDAPDVFTISVGNLPPNATVLIKITYVTELSVSEGAIVFRLPGSVAPWQQSSALNERTQDTVNKVCVTDMETERRFDLEMSVEMPYEMTHIRCPTHNIKMKRTQCKAVISTVKGDSLGPDGFLLSLTLSEMHLPRMWVEKHPDKDSQACMLVFYPAFESNTDPGEGEVVILLDTSNSMRGETLQNARRIALLALKALNCKVNILFFGTDFKELFPCSEYSTSVFESAKNFIMSAPPMKGSTDLWRPLRSLSLLAPSKGTRNLLLISDGHVQNEGLTLRLAQENVQHTRIFTCGVGSTANRHMLRSLAQSGGGAYEFFDTKMKHTWEEKVQSQVRRMASPGCSAVSVKWQQFHPSAPPPIQAPSQLHSLFNDCRQLVYGFVPHCTMATLLGKVSDQEIETMVSTSELQKTKGTLLHKLTARAVIRDYEDGSLHMDETEHEVKKSELKSYIVSLSKEFSIVTQYTSFVAIEERAETIHEFQVTDVENLMAKEDVDLLPYLDWDREEGSESDMIEYPLLLQKINRMQMISKGCNRGINSYSVDMAVPHISRATSSDQLPSHGKPKFSRCDRAADVSYLRLHSGVPQLGGLPTSSGGKFPAGSDPQESHPPASVLSVEEESDSLQSGLARSQGMWFSQTAPILPVYGVPQLSKKILQRSVFGGLSAQSKNVITSPQGFSAKAQSSNLFGGTNEAVCGGLTPSPPLPCLPPYTPPPPPPQPAAEISSSEYRVFWQEACKMSEQRPCSRPLPDSGIIVPNMGYALLKNGSMKTKKVHLGRKLKFSAHLKSLAADVLVIPWAKLFSLQHEDGYWECTAELGSILDIDVDYFANVFLKEKGILSLGMKARETILKLIATLLVLQLIRSKEEVEGVRLKTLFKLEEIPPQEKSERWDDVKMAVEWVKAADRQYPCIYSRLELGWDWESVTRQLLRIDPPQAHSLLRPACLPSLSLRNPVLLQ